MTADSRQAKAKKLSIFFSVLLFAASYVQAETHFIDLSKAANRGLAESFDEAVAGIPDLHEKNGLNDLPVGVQTFRGIPFQILNPAKNQNRSFVVLKGRRKPDFPEAVSIPVGHVKAGYLYFLHTCRWGGTAQNVTVAEYDVVYDDGQVAVIPLKVGVELTNFFGADDTSTSFLAWWYKYKNTEMGLNLFPWKNPNPNKPIQSILFKSRGNMPVPILFAITTSDKELTVSTVSPKPEKTFQTDTSKWIPLETSTASPAGTAIDMNFLLDAPAGKHGKVKADGDKLVFEDGTPARFWGVQLVHDWWNLTNEQLSRIVDQLAINGCNLVSIEALDNAGVTTHLQSLTEVLKAKGIYLDLTGLEQQVPNSLSNDPAILTQNLGTMGKAYRNDYSQSKLNPLEFQDEPLMVQPEKSIPCQLNFTRSLGLPFQVEWRDGWPNEYLGEAPLLMAAYGSYEDWAACVGMEMDGSGVTDVLSPTLNLSNKPTMLAQWPVATLAYLRGDLKDGKLFVLESRDDMPNITTSLKALAHRSGIRDGQTNLKTDVSGELKAKVNPKTKSFISDTGQIIWQGNVGVVKIEAPRFQALIGFLSHRKFNNAYWAVETPNPFASISLISLTKKSIADSDHLLLTGVTRMENTGMVYNQNKTKLLDPGHAPILVEPLSAQIVLYRFQKDQKLKVRALDINGKPLNTRVLTKWTKNNLVFSWVPSAFYLEIFKNPKNN